ncbi:RNA polymerase sigma factor [Enhygromyxa salina]|uniref:RNA polymerase sigma factor n=1 Tax=Enhygromyxa salina TaxID=215803 RepID=A0A2S9XHQ7_9BACT|nr:sigma-70 family RNA polymerase sigma factor [Enhygromyxa salina]PRP92408.1 RNA polymerase sigma factor [Enhygromyxa salina]
MDLDELLRAVRDEERGAWARLAPVLTVELRRYFSSWFGPDVAKDLTQATLVVLLDKLPGFEARESLRGWVFGIARNLAHNELRARYRRSELAEGVKHEPLAPARSPSSHARWRQRWELANEELEQLPDHYRDVIEHDLEGGDAGSFAEHEGISRTTARTRRHRAQTELADRVQRRAETPTSPPRQTPTPPS